MDESAGAICLSVEDNGRGFEPGSVRRGLGMATMEDYLGALGGSLRLDAGPGRGQRVTATAPLGPYTYAEPAD